MKGKTVKLTDDITVVVNTVRKATKSNQYGSYIRYTIRVRTENAGADFTFGWSDSISEYCKYHHEMTQEKYEDAIGSALMDALAYQQNSLDEFADEYGYENRSEAKHIYNQCGILWDKFSLILSEEEMRNYLNEHNL